MRWGRLRIGAGFVLLLVALVFFDEGMLLWVVWCSALLHELGHFAVLKMVGGRVEALDFHGGGVTMVQAATPALGYARELAAVLAGPLVSLICALLFSRMDGMMDENMAFSGMCAAQGLFNLLPARGLDGGRALGIALAMGDVENREGILRICSMATMILVAILGLTVFLITDEGVIITAVCVISMMMLLRELHDDS